MLREEQRDESEAEDGAYGLPPGVVPTQAEIARAEEHYDVKFQTDSVDRGLTGGVAVLADVIEHQKVLGLLTSSQIPPQLVEDTRRVCIVVF